MKFDKETVIVLLIAGLFLAGWAIYYPKYQKEKAQDQIRLEQSLKANENAKAAPAVPAAPAASAEPQKTVAKAEPTPAPASVPAEKTVSAPVQKAVTPSKPTFPFLENDLVKFTFNDSTGTIESAEFKKFRKDIQSEENLLIHPEGEAVKTLQTGLFSAPASAEVTKKDNTLTIVRTLPDTRVIEIFTLPPDSYKLEITYTVENKTDSDRTIPELTFWAAGMAPMKNLSSDKVNTLRQKVDFCLDKNKSVESCEPDPKKPEKLKEEETSDPVVWVGSTNKYFASLLFPKGTVFDNGLKLDQTAAGTKDDPYAIPSVGGSFKNVPLVKNGTLTWKFDYYCGPKELRRIDKLPETAMESMHIAYWSWFEFIARPLARFLVWLNDYIGNYGVAIIILTLLVRLVLWPFQQKANTSMRKMQKIQPKLKEMREKYKDNPQELNMRMMELYKVEGVNPLGGCLPMLLQLPIFFALYSVFDSAVELRHVSFLWAKDLAQPDQVGPAIQFLGFSLALHPLIIMMTVLMVVQQKMTPAQGDPSQQKIMMAMPVIMLVMLYWLPSGLTLYWTVSQLFSIIQLKYGQYAAAKEEAQASGGKKPANAK